MANSNPKVHVSSFTRGNRSEETQEFRTVGDVLNKDGISTTDCVLELTGSNGIGRDCSVNTVLQEGDFLHILKKDNKSGSIS